MSQTILASVLAIPCVLAMIALRGAAQPTRVPVRAEPMRRRLRPVD